MLVTHLISDMNKGGAQTMLYQIMKFRTTDAIDHRLLTLGLGSCYEEELEEMGYEVHVLDIKKRPFWTLRQIVKHLKGTDVLCCWMYHSNLIGYVCARLARIRTVVWCIRHSDLDPKNNSKKTLFINRICAVLSRRVRLIAYNGYAARTAHEKAGYDKRRGTVVENGCDLSLYRFNEAARRRIREEFGIEDEQAVILSVARYWPIKDVPTFIRTFARIHAARPETVALMCGLKIEADNVELCELCRKEGLIVGKDVLFAGFRTDIEDFMSAADLYILHSAGEAFPNTLIQAMASECLSVATDVGDVRKIMDDDALVVAPGDDKALSACAKRLLALSDEDKEAMRTRNRKRVMTHYDIKDVVKRYEKILRVAARRDI